MKEALSIVEREKVTQLNSRVSWLTLIKKYLLEGKKPKDKFERQKLRSRVAKYTLINGELYRHHFTFLYLTCLMEVEAEYVLNKVHEGMYGNHLKVRTNAHKLL